MEQRNNRSFKVVILGSTAVGKSSIMKRITDDDFNPFEESTIGAAFYSKTYPECNATLQIWDTAGQERYANLAPMYYRGANAIVSVYDVTNKNSYHRALEWVKDTSGHICHDGRSQVFSVLVGNKIDCDDADREVSTALGRKGTADELGIAHVFAETSAKTGENVHGVFENIAKHLSAQSNAPERRREFFLEEPVESKCCYN